LLTLHFDAAGAINVVSYQVRVETVMTHDDGKFLWYHPRVSAAASAEDKSPIIVMTLQKHLQISDYYSGLYVMRRSGPDGSWDGPNAVPELDWRPQTDGTTISVADVTPGWHSQTRKLIALGCEVPYSKKGEQLDNKRRQHQTVSAVFSPQTQKWTTWRRLEMPADAKFDFCRNACSQWLVRSNGLLLVPVYFGLNAKGPWSVTVLECEFDGERLNYLRHGDELSRNIERGLVEPSIARFGGRYYLTIRNDERGYVTTSEDGLHWQPLHPWKFDDGSDLGSYNTQQHWLAHSDGLFLVYTRRGANNNHIIRHRAPLFMAQVDPQTPCVIKSTEGIIIPEHGGELGNFGCASINSRESWVTVSEGVWSDEARARGAKGATFVALILWAKPNLLAEFK